MKNRRIFGQLITVLVVASALSAPSLADATRPVSGWDAAAAIVERIKPPVFPDRQFEVTKYGAKGDGATDCYKAFAAAIAACAQAGGGHVVVPAGDYACNGPIHLQSNVDLHLAEGSTILFGGTPDNYLVGDKAHAGTVLVRWEGTRCYNYSPLIYAFKQKNIAVTGQGVIDGQTAKIWAAWKKQQGADQGALRKMGQAGEPVEKRVFGKGHFLRPSLFQPYACENVLIEGVTVKGSPFWTLHPVLCTNVIVRGVSVKGGTTNDDGCDPESCNDVLIEKCNFTTADDNIAIKAGRDNDARAAVGGKPCENVVIRDCDFLQGAPGGVSIGSEMSGDVRNVFVENCRMKNVDRAFFIKSNPERGGTVEGIWFRDVAVERCTYLLKCEMDYKNVTAGKFPPTFRNIHMQRVTCKQAANAIDCQGLTGNPVSGVELTEITVDTSAKPLATKNVAEMSLKNVRVNGKPLEAP